MGILAFLLVASCVLGLIALGLELIRTRIITGKVNNA